MEKRKRFVPLSALIEIKSSDSSEDSDFRIEDLSEDSDELDISLDSEEPEDECDDSFKTEFVEKTTAEKENLLDTPLTLKKQDIEHLKLTHILICCVCLGDESDDDDEIVECDSCGVSVHEGCYGISETASVSSNDSEGSKMCWFCDACQAGKENPSCELCPNVGGIFKETDTGLWVHLVCALYVPGIAFREVTNLRGVTLFEMSYNKWGERICSLCPDKNLTRTGVCIGCDAGLCRAYFHVTCAQKEGLLSEAQSHEMDHADPYYAHCKLHSDKYMTKVRRRNWLAFESRMSDRTKINNKCMKTKLQQYQQKYIETNVYKHQSWIPTNKMSRPLTSSASTLRALSRKATLSGLDTQALAMKEAQSSALADIHRKWHIAPAFDFEYMGYYLDRNGRISSLKQNLNVQMEENTKLVKEQRELLELYSQSVKDLQAEKVVNKKLNSIMKIPLEVLQKFNLNKKLPECYISTGNTPNCPFSASLSNNPQSIETDFNTLCVNEEVSCSPESLCLTCAICSMVTDQHLLAKCDTCQLHYHLNCLDPPLTRMPKKTKVVGWQCSECDKNSSDSDIDVADTNIPRQLRHIKNLKSQSKASIVVSVRAEKKEVHKTSILISGNTDLSSVETKSQKKIVKKTKDRKRRNRNTVVSGNPRRQKIKKENSTLSKLSDPELNNESLEENCVSLSQTLIAETNAAHGSQFTFIATPGPSDLNKHKVRMLKSEITCDTCKVTESSETNIVTCDECLKSFHFHCLNPPVKKSPKSRGYSWHCTDCDPSESDYD